MALRNRAYVAEPERIPVSPQHQQSKTKVSRRKFITRQERVLYLGFVAIVAVMAIFVLHKQGEIQTTTIEIQKMESSISDISKENESAIVQISEKSTFDRIMAKAKELGFTLNEKNVKVVPGE